MVGGFDFISYAYSIFCISFGVLFLTGFLASIFVSLIAYYAQWRGLFMDSPAGYIPPTLWLLVAIGFFLVGYVNMK